MQERRNSISNALELRLSFTNPSICIQLLSKWMSIFAGDRLEIYIIFEYKAMKTNECMDEKILWEHGESDMIVFTDLNLTVWLTFDKY